MDNTKPLRKNELQDPECVAETLGTKEPQEPSNPDLQGRSDEVKRANEPADGCHAGRAGGESAPTESAEHGGPGMGQAPGGAKGTSGSGATAGGPFQSASGQTTAFDREGGDQSVKP